MVYSISVYRYIYTRTHIYIHAQYIHTHAYIYIYIMPIYIYLCIYTYIHVYIYTYKHVCRNIRIYTWQPHGKYNHFFYFSIIYIPDIFITKNNKSTIPVGTKKIGLHLMSSSLSTTCTTDTNMNMTDLLFFHSRGMFNY